MNYQYYTPPNDVLLPKNKKIVLVGGCFDILHLGHIQFLQKSRDLGNFLVVALEPDECLIQHKKRTPVHSQMERAHNLLALRAVDHIILLPLLHGFDDYSNLVKATNPDIIAITNNDPQFINKKKHADAICAQLVTVIDPVGSFSSSAIYAALCE